MTMDCEGILSMSYETQHFGFHPRIIFDRIYNDIYELLFDAMNALQDHFAEEHSNVMSQEAIKASADLMFQDLVKRLDKAIDKLEIYINSNIFMVPNHVVLPEDKVHITNPSTKEDEIKLDMEIEELKEKILKERIWIEYLKSEISQQKWVKDEVLSFKIKLEELYATILKNEITKENISSIQNHCVFLSNKMKECAKEKSVSCNGWTDLECSGDSEGDQ